MNRLFISLILVALAIGAFLIFQGFRVGTSLVLLPSELLAQSAEEPLPRIRVAGKVTAENIDYQIQPTAELRFRIQDPGKPGVGEGKSIEVKSIEVLYKGLKPDMFSAGRDVIIDGEYSNGVLLAHNLLTQCPSKYEPPAPYGKEEAKSN